MTPAKKTKNSDGCLNCAKLGTFATKYKGIKQLTIPYTGLMKINIDKIGMLITTTTHGIRIANA